MPKKRKQLSKFLEKYYELIECSDEDEIWKDIQLGDIPLYQISNHGRVRRKDNKYVINPFHSYRKKNDGEYDKNKPTYLRVQLYYYIDGKRYKKHFEISRLVAIHFIEIPKHYIDNGYTQDTLEVNHIKGGYEIYNNFVSNLEWCTPQENIIKSVETGLTHPRFGENHHSTYLNISDVIYICECIENSLGVKKSYELAPDEFKKRVSYKKFKPCFYNIKYKKSWKFVSCNFNF